MTIAVYIPSRGRSNIIMETTLPLLTTFVDKGVPINICVREEDYKDYEYLHHNKDYGTYLRKVSSKMGIGEKRAYITNVLAKEDKVDYIIQLDDDLQSVVNMAGANLYPDQIYSLVLSIIEHLEKTDAYYGGIAPYDNSFYFKNTITDTLKYVIGAFQVIRISNRKPISVSYKHFEDYIYCMEYFLRDGKIIRFNNYGIKTKYFNPVGGICEYYGGIEKRMADAEKVADEICEKYNGMCKKYLKKKSSRVPEGYNLKLNHHFKKP